jgi:hypothetical protein
MPAGLTVATEVLLLAHVPPGAAPVNVVLWPIHTIRVPEIVGATFTVATTVARQPVGNV